MKTENENKDISTWSEIKDRVYGKEGRERRYNLDREVDSRIGLLLKKACLFQPKSIPVIQSKSIPF